MNTIDDGIPAVSTDTTAAGAKPKMPEARVRDAAEGYAIFKKLETDDELAAWKRSNIDYTVDGGKPIDEAVLVDAGRGDDANVNFMEAKAEEDAACAPYVEMTTMTDVFWRVNVSYGDFTERERNNRIMSEELTLLHKEWGADFTHYRLGLAQQFTRHGIGFVYWKDELDWHWSSEGLNAFKLPRDTESRPSAIPYLICKKTIGVEELYAFIRDEKRAKEVNRWNVPAVKHAICSSLNAANRGYTQEAWEDFVKQARENDTTVGATKPKVPIYHLWVREFNGSMSHYIGHQKGAIKHDSDKIIGNGWLYQHRFRFKNLSRCIIPFTYGIGTHRTYHTVRGQGELSFDTITISNLTRCRMLDAVKAATSILLHVETPAEMEKMTTVQHGGFLMYSGGKMEPTSMPDVSDRLLPVLRDMQMLRQNITGSFQSRAITEGAQERTKYEIQAQQNQDTRLSSAALTLFLDPWGQVGHESFRRLVNPDLREDDPGGFEAFQFRRRCMKRGVPAAAFKAEFRVEAVRAIGNGSPQAAQYASEQVYSKSGGFDEIGRKNALRDVVASIPGVGWDNVSRYVGPDDPRPTIDDEIAQLENNDFRNGQHVPITSTQNHWVHCQHHSALVTESVQAFESQQMEPAQLVPILQAALENMLAHSEELNKDNTRTEEAGFIRKFLQNNGGTLQQQEQHLIAQMEAEQKKGQQEQQAQPDPQTAVMLERHRLDMQIKQEEFVARQREFEQKLSHQDAEARQKLALKDLEAAARLAEKNARMTVGMS